MSRNQLKSLYLMGFLFLFTFISIGYCNVKLKLKYDVTSPSILNSVDKIGILNEPDKRRDVLVFQKSNTFDFYIFDKTNLIIINSASIPFEMNKIKWVIGDVDNDNYDDILVYENDKISIFSGKEKSFIKKNIKTDLYIANLVIGDINNDNRNEIITFEYAKLDSELKKDYFLKIYTYKEDRFAKIWSDEGRMKYGEFTGRDYLINVSNFRNTSKNYLIISTKQSDVSPTKYHLLSYQDNQLSIEKKFIIANNEILFHQHNENFPYIAGSFIPIQINKEQYFISTQISDGYKFEKVLFKISNDKLVKYKFDDSDIPESQSGKIFYMNLDGNSKGLLFLDKDIVKFFQIEIK